MVDRDYIWRNSGILSAVCGSNEASCRDAARLRNSHRKRPSAPLQAEVAGMEPRQRPAGASKTTSLSSNDQKTYYIAMHTIPHPADRPFSGPNAERSTPWLIPSRNDLRDERNLERDQCQWGGLPGFGRSEEKNAAVWTKKLPGLLSEVCDFLVDRLLL